MKTVILDTNFLVEVIRFRINLFSELERICDFNYEVKVLDKTIEELKTINKKESKVALNLIKGKKIRIIKTESEKGVDDLLVEIANEKFIIATQDKLLKSRLKKKSIKTLIIRQKKYLVIK